MTDDLNTTPPFPALEKLGEEFGRVARAEAEGRRRPRLKRLAVAFAGAVIVVPAALAIGQVDLGGSDGLMTREEAVEAGLISPDEERLADEVDFAAPEGAADWIVKECRFHPAKAPLSAFHCEALIAIDEGRLAPGEYEDEELREALRK